MRNWLDEVLKQVKNADDRTGRNLLLCSGNMDPLRVKRTAGDAGAPVRGSILPQSEPAAGESALPDNLEKAQKSDPGFWGLYRAAVREMSESSAPVQRRFEPEKMEPTAGPAGLTAEQLDLEFRRDSRRFDGGMNLY